MNRSLRHPARVGFIVVLAAVANLWPLPLPGDVQLFLGPFIYMPLVLALRGPWSLLAAAIPMAVTIDSVGHPFALANAVLEAAWLATRRPRQIRSPVARDALFWAVLAWPTFGWLAWQRAQIPGEIALIMAVRQVLNQLGAVALAAFLLRHTQLNTWLTNHTPPRRRLRDTVMQAVFALTFLPLAAVAVAMAVMFRAYCDREDHEDLHVTGKRLTQQLEDFYELHTAAVATAAATLSRGGADPAILLAETQRAFPSFTALFVADATGAVHEKSAAAPRYTVMTAHVADREYFRQARDGDRPFVSGVFRGRTVGRDLLVAISAPIHDAQGRFAGIVAASLDVNGIAEEVAGAVREESVDLIFVDGTGRVIFADPRLHIPSLAHLQFYPQGELLAAGVEERVVHFDDPPGRADRHRWSMSLTRCAGGDAVVIAQRPVLAGLRGVAWLPLMLVTGATAIVGAAYFVAWRTRLKTAVPLEYFADATTRQAALGTVVPLESHFAAAPYEVWIVFRAFNRLAHQVQRSHAQLLQTNAELDRRVVERTAEAEIARQQAEAANRSKDEFLAMTSHEIRTPLNAIIGLTDAVLCSVREPVAIERLRTIRTSGRRLLTVVNDLLDLSRIEAGKLDLRPAPVDLRSLCEDVRVLFALRARQQGLRFDVEVEAPPACWIEVDAVRLQQVLINLIGNALKFTRMGRVCLRVLCLQESAEEITLRFAVIDTGPGIPAAAQARLFKPYVQLASHTAAPGSGLGLFISRRLVDRFGGTLAVLSAEGAGAEFHFALRFRRCAAPAERTVAPAEPASPTGLGATRILAADDNLANQEVLRSMLEGHCAAIEVVDGAAPALATLARAPFDVALIDLEMPGADGFSVARTVRAWADGQASRGCRLIAVSAHGREAMWARCAESGFDDFVEKPVERRELLRVIRSQVGRAAQGAGD